MFGPQEDNQTEEEQIPLNHEGVENTGTQQQNARKIYPVNCDGCMKPTKFFCTNCMVVLHSNIIIQTSKETCIPLMIDYMKDYIHSCPVCHKIVGKREYTIAKPLKILMIVLIVIVVIVLILFLMLSIFYGNQMWEEFKKIQKFKKGIENGEGE